MKNKILKSLTPVFGVASLIMFLGWVIYTDISGWIWFSCLLVFVFLNSYNED